MALFRSHVRAFLGEEELFYVDSWISVLHGQNICLDSYDPVADIMDIDQLKEKLHHAKRSIRHGAETSATHDEFIQFNCRAEPVQ